MHILVEFSCLKYKRVWEDQYEEGLLTYPLVLKGEVISSGGPWSLDLISLVPKKTHSVYSSFHLENSQDPSWRSMESPKESTSLLLVFEKAVCFY